MNSASRVLMIQPTGVSGIWHYANALSRALMETGLEVALATLLPFEDLGGKGGAPVWSIGTRPPHMSALPPFRRVVNHVHKLKRLHQVMTGFRPGIVHLHAPLGKLDFIYFKYLRALGARIVYTAHDARPLVGEASWFDWARYREADGILVHSSSCAKHLVAGGIDAAKITCVPHGNYLHFCVGADLSAVHAKERLGLPVGARVVLFFGAIAPYKGLDVLIEAFSRLRSEEPDVYLIIAGEPLEDFAPYRRQVEGLALTERVVLDLRYIPFSEFGKYFLAADVLVLPYRRISQSGVLQLAYGYGRPVVVTDVGGLAEAVVEDHTGIVVDRLDAESLAVAVRRLLSDPREAALMGRRSRRLAETKYSWRAIAERINGVYRSLYSRADPQRSYHTAAPTEDLHGQ